MKPDRLIKRVFLTAAPTLLALQAVSCHAVFEDEEKCETVYNVHFIYDMNLKWADAFSSEVNSVNLYIFDKEGVFIQEISQPANPLTPSTYRIPQELIPGEYMFLAWCGLESPEGKGESFTVPQPVAGVTRIEDLTCTLNTVTAGNGALESDTQLKFLFHGLQTYQLDDNSDGREYSYPIYLTKDTNHIRIILQELSGDDMVASDYSVSIECADGSLAYNNDLIASPIVTYMPWAQQSDIMGLGEQDGNIKYNYGLVADLSVSRMMASQEDEMYLTVRNNNSDSNIIARVPIIQYALLAKSYYEDAYGHVMTNQEFLDREDEYQMTFFLYNDRWQNSYIDINSWRVVLHNYDVE